MNIDEWKPLKDFTDLELYEILKKNQAINADYLSYICSEILRRKLYDEYEKMIS